MLEGIKLVLNRNYVTKSEKIVNVKIFSLKIFYGSNSRTYRNEYYAIIGGKFYRAKIRYKEDGCRGCEFRDDEGDCIIGKVRLRTAYMSHLCEKEEICSWMVGTANYYIIFIKPDTGNLARYIHDLYISRYFMRRLKDKGW